ncbi:MAG: hypothetical protein HC808_13275 [Candidatus Competibacteraceae bacterium]|nr:hypothetical protein [Candidatus Competibacteraceae bacterium]
MNCRSRRKINPSPEAQADIARVIDIWCDCWERYGQGGDWLFGHFTIADAMFSPVVSRFNTYGVELPEVAQQYAATMNAHPALQEWVAAGHAETEIIEEDEAGTPI